jgi:lipopolysaccharide transport protein LptA
MASGIAYRLLFGAMLFTGMALPAAAQIANSDDPIEITAEASAEYFRTEGRVIYTKNVRATQGLSRITSDTLTVTCARSSTSVNGKPDESCDDIARIVAVGKVRYETPTEIITGDRIEYNAQDEILTVTGDVYLVRGNEGAAQGTKVVYNVREGRATITSDRKPVVGIFNAPRREGQGGAN